jgi:hypothetical protein
LKILGKYISALEFLKVYFSGFVPGFQPLFNKFCPMAKPKGSSMNPFLRNLPFGMSSPIENRQIKPSHKQQTTNNERCFK